MVNTILQLLIVILKIIILSGFAGIMALTLVVIFIILNSRKIERMTISLKREGMEE